MTLERSGPADWTANLRRDPARALVILCVAQLSIACAEPPAPPPAGKGADVVYFNGDVITMNDAQPTAAAVAITNGEISAVGDVEDMHRFSADDTQWADLQGNTLLPGFFDSHSHLVLTSAKLAVVNTDPPPAGPADSITSIQRVLSEGLASDPPADGDWLVGWGYDHAMLAEERHPTRVDLDAVSTEVPIVLIHFSTHQVVVNSAGLALAGITAASADPEGGRIERVPGSREPNGILQENAMYPVAFPVLDKLVSGGADIAAGERPGPSAIARVDAALREYASRGFTTVTEMGATPLSLALLEEMSRQRRLSLDVVAAGISKAFTVEQIASLHSRRYRDGLRVGGLKIVLDGGSPGRSAYLSQPYHQQRSGEQGYRGYPHFEDTSALNALVAAGYRLEVPVYIHALGDAAVEQAVAAIEHAGGTTSSDRRTQLIHVQQAREEQLDRVAALGATLTFQVAHNYYFGDFHEAVTFGPARTARLNPIGSAIRRGISVSIHHDSPVHPVDQMLLIWATVNRVTRSGRTIGPEQRISVLDALKASTINAAYQFFEDDVKGSIETGKKADLVILSANPLKVDPLAIADIRVIETIKDGVSIYRRD